MRAPFSWLTTRGKAFAVAGGAALACGVTIPEPDLGLVGALLVLLPLVSALIFRRSRHRVSYSRSLDRRRVPAGQPATVTVRLENVSRLRTGVLLAEDLTSYALGSRPRFVVEEIEPGGHRELSYQLRFDTRGKFTIGPLRVRAADAFGLVEISRSFSTTGTVVVTPTIFPLPRAAAVSSSRLGEGNGGGMRTISAIGEDDAAPRLYQDGDGLRRVHWKSTARYGELMVRREEHRRRNSASVFLDTRNAAQAGRGPSASFEFAVSAAASIAAHLSGEGFGTRLITDAGEIAPCGTFDDSQLDKLALITPSQEVGFGAGMSALASAGGQLIAIAGRLTAADASLLAATRRGNAPAMALLLAISGWATDQVYQDTAQAAEILSAAGWRVAVATATTPLTVAWQQLHRPVGRLLSGGSVGARR